MRWWKVWTDNSCQNHLTKTRNHYVLEKLNYKFTRQIFCTLLLLPPNLFFLQPPNILHLQAPFYFFFFCTSTYLILIPVPDNSTIGSSSNLQIISQYSNENEIPLCYMPISRSYSPNCQTQNSFLLWVFTAQIDLMSTLIRTANNKLRELFEEHNGISFSQ